MKLKQDRFGHKAGTVVFPYRNYDYGLCRDDDYAFPSLAPHIAVTIEEGKTPFFTVPKAHIEEQE